ncbi:virB8 family protein [Rhizorhapis suberifaciens]|uniref:Type IV secretion system protein VirB8 n=1 Tax=Rhizorhapis suberifaciens TaxID=13656 RepID=A0A840HY53_9SPHN|nr:VirB8/TrbF family protein [Rhizorhapis suberifaciens]MBB4642581.1 type IV secretion system protein VirB8 [Rhizorhapis suberifaciens]
MTPKNRAALETYYKDAATWADDRRQSLASSRRVAWIVAIIAIVIALAEAFALILLVPLKREVPYTLLVDRQTGNVQKLDPLDANRIAPDAALTQSFLVQYVLARENFDFGTVKGDYRKAWAWSADSARNDYTAYMQVTNPASPLLTVPRGSSVEAQVRSISPLGAGSALVRFETVRRDNKGSEQERRNWVAMITYRYSHGPMSMEERFINPLGFQVTRYKRSPEAPPQSVEVPLETRQAESAGAVTPTRQGQ